MLRPSTLSGIPEQLVLDSTIYLLLIGPNAWRVTEEFCKASQEEFQVESRATRGFRATRVRAKTSCGVNYLSDHPPVSCTVLVKSPEDQPLRNQNNGEWTPENSPRNPRIGGGSEDGFAEGDSEPSGRTGTRASGAQATRASARASSSTRPRSITAGRSSARSSARSSTAGRLSMRDLIPGLGRKPRDSTAESLGGSDALPGHQAVKVYCFPVEKFSESVPHCRTVEQWRAMCMVFLMDSRATEMGDPIKDLHGRLEEVRRWVGNFIQASDVKSAPAHLQVVLQHKGANDLAESSETELAFVGKVRELARAPQSEIIHHFCDLDDPNSLMKRIVKVLQDLKEKRHGDDYDFEPDFLEKLERKDQEARLREAAAEPPRSCCAAM